MLQKWLQMIRKERNKETFVVNFLNTFLNTTVKHYWTEDMLNKAKYGSYLSLPPIKHPSTSSFLSHLLLWRKQHTVSSAGQMWSKATTDAIKGLNRTRKCAFSMLHCLLWSISATGGLTGGPQSTGAPCSAGCARLRPGCVELPELKTGRYWYGFLSGRPRRSTRGLLIRL